MIAVNMIEKGTTWFLGRRRQAQERSVVFIDVRTPEFNIATSMVRQYTAFQAEGFPDKRSEIKGRVYCNQENILFCLSLLS